MKAIKNSYNPGSLQMTRKKLGLTQQQMAEELQLSRCTITLIEQGKRSLSTTALLKLATLEMQHQDNPADKINSVAVPNSEHYVIAKSRRSVSSLLLQEATCRLKSRKLTVALDQMMAQHERISHWMKMAENTIENAEIKKQKLVIQKKLDKCGLPAQGLLRHEITLMNAQADLYLNMQKHVEEELKKHDLKM